MEGSPRHRPPWKTASTVDHLVYRSPGPRPGYKMVRLMWQVVLASTSPRVEQAASIAKYMLVDALALLGPA